MPTGHNRGSWDPPDSAMRSGGTGNVFPQIMIAERCCRPSGLMLDLSEFPEFTQDED